ncbi:MAG: aspartate carbamoyltransferase [Myxococcota bacterium]
MRMNLSLDQFLSLSEAEQLPYIGRQGVLYASQFDRHTLDHLCRVAEAARVMHQTPAGAQQMSELLRHRMALNFFIQPSSRTFMSFNTAQAFLGLSRMSVRDAKISSMSKGESLVDSVRTFISYVDLVVMRHPDENAAATAFWTSTQAHRRVHLPDGDHVPVPIVSGGSGTKHHPTQALLDVYTLQKSLGTIDGRTLMLVGDLGRGRTVRSLAQLMRNYSNVTLLFAAPEKYQMLPDITAQLDAAGVDWHVLPSLESGIDAADAVYMTRIQDEWDGGNGGEHVRADPAFAFRPDHLDRMKPNACLMHPLPKRDEIDPALDYIDDERIVYWRQERNGMWMRVALLAWLFRVESALLVDAPTLQRG